MHGNAIVAKFAGIESRNDAELLLRSEIWIETATLLDFADGEYYWFQLIGLRVETPQGQSLGIISSLIETGANDVLVVQDKKSSSAGKNQEILIPYIVGDVVKQINLEQQLMIVEWQTDYD